jgi:hypothetical protein
MRTSAVSFGNRGRALVVAVNKWDGLDAYVREQIKGALEGQMSFIDFARFHYVSALKGQGLEQLFRSVDAAYKAAIADLPTPKLTRALIDAGGEAGAAAQRAVPAEAALRPPGWQESAADRDSWQCARQDRGFVSPLPRAYLPGGVQAAGDAAANPVQRQQQSPLPTRKRPSRIGASPSPVEKAKPAAGRGARPGSGGQSRARSKVPG